MSDDLDTELEGADEHVSALGRLGDMFENSGPAGIEAVLDQIVERAKSFAPGGRIRNSIRKGGIEISGEEISGVVIAGDGSTMTPSGVDFALVQELGSPAAHVQGIHYLERAAMEVSGAADGLLGAHMAEGLEG